MNTKYRTTTTNLFSIPVVRPDAIGNHSQVCKKSWCRTNITMLESMLTHLAVSDETNVSCRLLLNRAKRFLKSDEIGGCEFEIRMARRAMGVGRSSSPPA